MSWHNGGSKLRAVRVAPGRLACVRSPSRYYTRLTEISDADEPKDDDYLRELAFQRICLPRDG
jgi:hypothetical protein